MKRYVSVLLVVLALFALVACSSAGDDEAPATPDTSGGEVTLDGAAILAERCGTCHATSVVDGVENDAVGWAAVIDDMIDLGATIPDDEAAALAEYLANR